MLEGWNESEMQVDSPTSHNHIELRAVRLYNPSTHRWAIYGSSIKTGVFDPPMIGQFSNGRGELYSQDTWQDRAIFVRFETGAGHFPRMMAGPGRRTGFTKVNE